MPLPKRICRTCGSEFELTPTKPGNINDCKDCAVEVVKPYYAMVAPTSKNSCLTEITLTQDAELAHRFNSVQKRRGGSGVVANIVERKS